MNSELSREVEDIVAMHQVSALSPFLFAVVVDFVIELPRDGALGEMLYADDLVLMSETIKGLWNTFLE